MIKIALIEPPYQFYRRSSLNDLLLPLLWMMCLGTYLKEMIGKELSIEYLDGQILGLQKILGKLKESKPQFIGLCPKYSSYENTLIIARAAKKLGSKVIMGGPHADPLAKEILLNRGSFSTDYCVDAVIRGDGEKALYEYIIGENPVLIKNLVFTSGGKIIENPKEYLNLDKLPVIDRDLINPEPYLHLLKKKNPKWKMVWPVFSHKGCFYGNLKGQGCIFCGGDKNLRLKSPAIFWREIDSLVKRYRAAFVVNLADALPLDMRSSWFNEFYTTSTLCKKKPRLRLRTLPHFINPQTVKTLKKLNVYGVRLPVTDFYPGCAASSFGGYNKKKLEDFCYPFKLLNQAGIIVTTYFMPGAFYEKEEDSRKILELSRLLKKLKNIHIVSSRGHFPFPGSKGWQMFLEKTGDKYRNRDLINWKEVGPDWVKHFSDPKLMPMIKSIKDKIPNV